MRRRVASCDRLTVKRKRHPNGELPLLSGSRTVDRWAALAPPAATRRVPRRKEVRVRTSPDMNDQSARSRPGCAHAMLGSSVAAGTTAPPVPRGTDTSRVSPTHFMRGYPVRLPPGAFEALVPTSAAPPSGASASAARSTSGATRPHQSAPRAGQESPRRALCWIRRAGLTGRFEDVPLGRSLG